MLFTHCSDEVWGKFSNLQQVSSPNSQDDFQICCADMYMYLPVVRFLVGFRLFLWISRDFADLLEIHGSATARNIRSPAHVSQISSLLSQIELVKLVITKLWGNSHIFWLEKLSKCGGDIINLYAFFAVLFWIWLVTLQSTCQNQIKLFMYSFSTFNFSIWFV